MKTIDLKFPTIESLLNDEFGSWLEKATSLPNSSLWLSELESALEVLMRKCGESSVKTSRLKSAVEQAVSAKDQNELESLLFEVLCLGKLASVAEEIYLLEPFAPKGQPVPEAKMRIAYRECVIECLHHFREAAGMSIFGVLLGRRFQSACVKQSARVSCRESLLPSNGG